MEELLESLAIIEGKHLFNLYSYVEHVFHDKHLPSHGQNHHLRVWLHCRGMLIELSKIGLVIPEQLIENAIFACFFHDTGLVDEIGERHGARSAEICKAYLAQINYNDEQNARRIVEAIELHDDKSIKTKRIASPSDMLDLCLLVSTADDLDAIGYIGVFRYIEIYYKRGIPVNEIPLKVVKNLKNRRNNFVASYSSLLGYCERQKQRFAITLDFFTELDSILAQNVPIHGNPLDVYNIFTNVIKNSIPLKDVIQDKLKNSTSGYTIQFFSKLDKEISVMSVIIPDVVF